MSVLRRVPRPILAAAGSLAAWLVAGAVLPDGAPLGVVLQGVVFGTVTALLAMGLILIYRTSNIVNFAYGSMGGVGGVLAVSLYLDAGLPYFVAAGLGVLTGVAVGALVEVLVIRRFSGASRLVLTVATIGLAQLLGAVQLLIPKWFQSSGLVGGFKTPFTFHLNIDPVVFTGDHLLIVAAVPPIIAGLAWFLLRTDAGVAVRAAADNTERALLLGIPVRRLSTIVWAVSGGLAALTFILRAPFAGSTSTALAGPSLLLPALAAAVVARMESLPAAFAAGIGLGVLEQLVFWNTGRATAIDVAFLVVILVALLLQRNQLSRAHEGAGSWSLTAVARPIPVRLRGRPEVRIARALVLATVGVLAIVVPMHAGPSNVNLMAVAVIWGMVAVSLVVLTGWGGHISLGQFAIVGCGAVAAGNILERWDVDMFVVLVAAGAVGALVALLIGLPALRIRGLFLAVTTLAFAVALDSYFLNPTNFPEYVPDEVHRPVLWQRFDLESQLAMYYLCLAFLVLTVLACAGVRRSRSGRVLLATRDNVRAAGAAAVPTTRVKLTTFVFSGTIAGVAGGLYVLLQHGARAGSFQPSMSLDVFSMAAIGGLGSVSGALLGVFTFRFLSKVLTGELRMAVTGAGLLFVLLALPGGLGQFVTDGRDRLLRLLPDRADDGPPPAEVDLLSDALEAPVEVRA
ncbi:MAG: ABC-type branched-chain amino acid transport system, permease component [Acidimicrobiales bacterium]|nr:ABC-type branched-chain amino acid transport system, permease component [Acidimicrobiales bacterium]